MRRATLLSILLGILSLALIAGCNNGASDSSGGGLPNTDGGGNTNQTGTVDGRFHFVVIEWVPVGPSRWNKLVAEGEIATVRQGTQFELMVEGTPIGGSQQTILPYEDTNTAKITWTRVDRTHPTEQFFPVTFGQNPTFWRIDDPNETITYNAYGEITIGGVVYTVRRTVQVETAPATRAGGTR